MKKLSLIHLGVGNVGKEVIAQIAKQKKKLEKEIGISFVSIAQFTSKNSIEEIERTIKNVSLPFALIDTTASDKTVVYIKQALKRGGFAILANKKPLAGLQKDFDMLHATSGKRLLYECVVGAGLPVIQTLKNLLDSGDEILEIQGCFSGTLGFLFSQLDSGKLFSKAVLEAKERGFTEPNPRDDLSGLDVARKALILSRITGKKLELSDIQLDRLYPKNMQHLSVDAFMKNLNNLDFPFAQKLEKAREKGKLLRFVANVSQKECRVGLTEVDEKSDIGSLRGPDNIIVFKTKQYFDNSLVIKGPGAGISVTAAGVFGNILDAAKMI